MNINKTKKIISVLIAILLIGSLICTFVACDKKDTNNDKKPDNSQNEVVKTPSNEWIIPNGDFANTTGETSPLTPDKWTAKSEQDAKKGISGVVNLDNSEYDKFKKNWDNIPNPGKSNADDKDSNALMIYNKVGNKFYYKNSFTSQIGKCYEISISVKTVNINEKGAYIHIGELPKDLKETNNINTESKWVTYKFYLEASDIKKTSHTIYLGLGDQSEVQGYVFFDNVVANEITKAEYDAKNYSATEYKYSLKVPDAEMEKVGDLSDGIYNTNESGYSFTVGGEGDNKAPNTSSYRKKGIIDIKNFNEDKLFTKPANLEKILDIDSVYGNNALMVYNLQDTAGGLKGRTKIRFNSGYYFKVSVYVLSNIEDENKENRGATLRLLGDDEIEINNINTNGEWVQYSFFIEANQYVNKDFYLEMALGRGDKEDKDTLTKGYAFFKHITLTQYDNNTEYQNAINNPNASTKTSSLVTNSANSIKNTNFSEINNDSKLPLGWDNESPSDDVVINQGDIIKNVISETDLKSSEWTDALKEKYGIDSNPKMPNPTFAPVYFVNNTVPTVFGMGLTDTFEIKKNKQYRLSIWVKTKNINKDTGLKIKLVGDKGNDKEEDLTSFTKVNTNDFENAVNNDYAEIVFYINGNQLENRTARVVIQAGEGNRYDTTNFLKGEMYFANINMDLVKETEYSNASTSTYTKKYSFANNDSTVKNGNFNSIDLKDSEIDADGNLINKPGKPVDWKLSRSDKNVTAGIINSKNTALLNKLGLSNIYNTDGWEIEGYTPDFGSPNLLMIRANATNPDNADYTGKVKSIRYKSENISFSKSSYYLVKGLYKTTDGANASIYLDAKTNIDSDNYKLINTNGEWKEFIYVVSTGINDVKATISLYLGSNVDSDTLYGGTVFFDSISYVSIDKDRFTELSEKEGTKVVAYKVDSFDDTSDNNDYDYLKSPNNWTTQKPEKDKAPMGSDNLIYGVMSNENDTKFDKFGVKDKDGNIIDSSKIDSKEMQDFIYNNTNTNHGNNVLVINNKVPTAFAYKTSSSQTLDKNKYYKVTVWALTYDLKENESARIMLSVGDATYTLAKVNTSTYTDGKETKGQWTEYNYYIKTDKEKSSSSVYLTLGLGKYTANNPSLISGYAFFDNFVIDEINADEFKTADENKDETFRNGNKVITLKVNDTTGADTNTDKDKDEPAPANKDNFNWLLISTTIIGGVIVVVMILVIIVKMKEKYGNNKRTKFKKSSYDKRRSNNKKSDNNDKYNKYKD